MKCQNNDHILLITYTHFHEKEILKVRVVRKKRTISKVQKIVVSILFVVFALGCKINGHSNVQNDQVMATQVITSMSGSARIAGFIPLW